MSIYEVKQHGFITRLVSDTQGAKGRDVKNEFLENDHQMIKTVIRNADATEHKPHPPKLN